MIALYSSSNYGYPLKVGIAAPMQLTRMAGQSLGSQEGGPGADGSSRFMDGSQLSMVGLCSTSAQRNSTISRRRACSMHAAFQVSAQ